MSHPAGASKTTSASTASSNSGQSGPAFATSGSHKSVEKHRLPPSGPRPPLPHLGSGPRPFRGGYFGPRPFFGGRGRFPGPFRQSQPRFGGVRGSSLGHSRRGLFPASHRQPRRGSGGGGGGGAGGDRRSPAPSFKSRQQEVKIPVKTTEKPVVQTKKTGTTTTTTIAKTTVTTSTVKSANIPVVSVLPSDAICEESVTKEIKEQGPQPPIKEEKQHTPKIVQQQPQEHAPLEEESHVCQLHNDTLNQCLEQNGEYVCKSFGPRCFIIQKVSEDTSNSSWNRTKVHNKHSSKNSSANASDAIPSSLAYDELGLSRIGETRLEPKARIVVEPHLVTWESCNDLCSFYRSTLSSETSAATAVTEANVSGSRVGCDPLTRLFTSKTESSSSQLEAIRHRPNIPTDQRANSLCKGITSTSPSHRIETSRVTAKIKTSSCVVGCEDKARPEGQPPVSISPATALAISRVSASLAARENAAKAAALAASLQLSSQKSPTSATPFPSKSREHQEPSHGGRSGQVASKVGGGTSPKSREIPGSSQGTKKHVPLINGSPQGSSGSGGGVTSGLTTVASSLACKSSPRPRTPPAVITVTPPTPLTTASFELSSSSSTILSRGRPERPTSLTQTPRRNSSVTYYRSSDADCSLAKLTLPRASLPFAKSNKTKEENGKKAPSSLRALSPASAGEWGNTGDNKSKSETHKKTLSGKSAAFVPATTKTDFSAVVAGGGGKDDKTGCTACSLQQQQQQQQQHHSGALKITQSFEGEDKIILNYNYCIQIIVRVCR